jgi:hypothetical protein
MELRLWSRSKSTSSRCFADGPDCQHPAETDPIQHEQYVSCVPSLAPNILPTDPTEAAVVHMTRSLAVEWATKGVRVNCIS